MLFKKVICFFMGLLILVSFTLFSNDQTKDFKNKSFNSAAEELQHYQIKIIETHFFLYQVFNHIKLKIRDTQQAWLDKNNISVSLRKISGNSGMVLMIERLEQSFETIYSQLKESQQEETNNQLTKTNLNKDKIDIFIKKITKLSVQFKHIFLAKNLIDTYYSSNQTHLEFLYQEAKKELEEKEIDTLFFSKKNRTSITQQTCFNLDNALITATHSLTKTKLLIDNIIYSLKKKTKTHTHFLTLIRFLDFEIKKIDQSTGCISLYYEILRHITQPKIERVHKFLTDKDYNKRKRYLHVRLKYSVFMDNRFESKKDLDLIHYFNHKSQLMNNTENKSKKDLYLRFSKELKSCQPRHKIWI